MRHNISTTIVEIDPAIYKAARTFFGLPDPANLFLEDARKWTAQRRAKIDAGHNEILFDIVVHDCFSGGGVPEHIYTLEFWSDLKAVMQSDGLLVVVSDHSVHLSYDSLILREQNVVGVVKSESSKLIVNTVERSFGLCRAFHDLLDSFTEEKYNTEFINMVRLFMAQEKHLTSLSISQVLFCTQSSAPLSFREARKSDWLGSPLRQHVLQSLDTREINLDSIRSAPGDDQYILMDHNNPLGGLQEKQSNHHWFRMFLPIICQA